MSPTMTLSILLLWRNTCGTAEAAAEILGGELATGKVQIRSHTYNSQSTELTIQSFLPGPVTMAF